MLNGAVFLPLRGLMAGGSNTLNSCSLLPMNALVQVCENAGSGHGYTIPPGLCEDLLSRCIAPLRSRPRQQAQPHCLSTSRHASIQVLKWAGPHKGIAKPRTEEMSPLSLTDTQAFIDHRLKPCDAHIVRVRRERRFTFL